MLKKFRGLLSNPFDKTFLIVLIVINFLGSIYGFYWYKDQLASTPVKYWLFVPDSPFSSSLFTLILILILIGKRNTLLEFFACAGVIKYGIWAAIINFHILTIGGDFGFDNFMLATSHLGMAIEGFVFFRYVKLSRALVLLTLFWMLLNDYMDYWVGVHPYLFDESQLSIALGTALVLTFGISFYMLKLSKVGRKISDME